MIRKLLLGFTLLVLTTQPVFAQEGGSEHGNGGGLVYLNGVPKLAGAFVKSSNAGTEMILSDDMKKLLSSIQILLDRRYLNLEEFFAKFVFSPFNEYRYVTKLDCTDSRDVVTKDGRPLIDYACTYHGVTQVLKTEFESLSADDQAVAIIHERLHAFNPNASHAWIYAFEAAVSKMLELKQSQASGQLATLSDDDVSVLQNVYMMAAKLGLPTTGLAYSEANCLVLKQGGGLLCRYADEEKVSSLAQKVADLDNPINHNFFGIVATLHDDKAGSFVSESTVIDSDLSSVGTLHLAKIKSSILKGTPLVVIDSTITDSVWRNSTRIKNSTIANSQNNSAGFIMSSNFDHCAFNAYKVDASEASCENSKVRAANLTLSERSHLSNSNMTLYAPFALIDTDTEISNFSLDKFTVDGNGRTDSLTFSSGTPLVFQQARHYECSQESHIPFIPVVKRVVVSSVDELDRKCKVHTL